MTFSGFNGNTPATPGHVYVTRNGLSGAATWTNISGDLPDIPINGVIFDPASINPLRFSSKPQYFAYLIEFDFPTGNV